MISMSREEFKERIRTWLEYRIKSARGSVISVSSRKFYNWLGDPNINRVEFWKCVEELAPELGLVPIECLSRNRKRRVVYLIRERVKF